MTKFVGTLSTAFIVLLLASRGHTQALDPQHFHPAVTTQGLTTVKGAHSEAPWDTSLTFYTMYMRNPLVVVDGASNRMATLVSDRIDMGIAYAMGIDIASLTESGWVNGIDVAAIVPFVPWQHERSRMTQGRLTAFDNHGAGIADPRIQARITLPLPHDLPLAVAFIPVLTLPMASGAGYLGNGSFVFTPEVAASMNVGPLMAAMNLGIRTRGNKRHKGINVTEQWIWRMGVGLDVGEIGGPETLVASLEAFGVTRGRRPFGSIKQSPVEWTGTARYRIADFLATVGLGGGLNSGYGNPKIRIFGSAMWAPRETDADHDGFEDDVDSCPNRAEDKDGFEDEDGCPDVDNDGDGVQDIHDACPNTVEDNDGFEDEDGCPDADNDGDQVLDVADDCPLKPEDVNGLDDEDGCPDAEKDSDRDAVPDAIDACPTIAEDRDGFEDDDGCPDFDNDGDGIRDDADPCPNEAEVINGFEDEDGCPDEGAQLVKLTSERIEILEKVFFNSGSDVIQIRSHGLLDQVVAVLKNNSSVRIRIEGHTDSQGRATYNLQLSQRRAHAVRTYLIERGIEQGRIEAQGYGETRSIASNASRRGRETNRRVEFNVIGAVPTAP